jgi:hypothetical protein
VSFDTILLVVLQGSNLVKLGDLGPILPILRKISRKYGTQLSRGTNLQITEESTDIYFCTKKPVITYLNLIALAPEEKASILLQEITSFFNAIYLTISSSYTKNNV